MRVRLKWDLFLDPRHGLYKDRELDVLEVDSKPRYKPGEFGSAWVMSDLREVNLWSNEFEIVEEGDIRPIHHGKIQT